MWANIHTYIHTELTNLKLKKMFKKVSVATHTALSHGGFVFLVQVRLFHTLQLGFVQLSITKPPPAAQGMLKVS